MCSRKESEMVRKENREPFNKDRLRLWGGEQWGWDAENYQGHQGTGMNSVSKHKQA